MRTFFLSALLLQSIPLQAASGSLATYNSKFTAYASGPSNDIVTGLTWDEILKSYNKIERDAKASFIFRCPGDTFLVGTQSHFEGIDRQFYFICRSLQDPQGLPILSGTSTDTSSWESLRASHNFSTYDAYSAYENNFGGAGASTCNSTQALSGVLSRFVDQTSTSGGTATDKMDRQWQSICQTMKDATGAPLSAQASTCKSFAQPESGNFTFTCPVNQLVSKLASSFNNGIRSYTFTCCQYGT